MRYIFRFGRLLVKWDAQDYRIRGLKSPRMPKDAYLYCETLDRWFRGWQAVQLEDVPAEYRTLLLILK